jgi:signal transduction histidine kinase
LLKTLKKLVEEVQEKKADAEFILDLPEEMEEPSQQISLTVYRICQEALHNIVRHSEANRAFIQLSEDPITLVIQDNGKGFSPVDDFSNLAENNHFGLVGMKERTEALGGSFQVISEPGKGTVIRMMLPGDVLSRPEG